MSFWEKRGPAAVIAVVWWFLLIGQFFNHALIPYFQIMGELWVLGFIVLRCK